MEFIRKYASVCSLVALTACSGNFEQKGDERLVGEWNCSLPEIIKTDPNIDAELVITFEASGMNTINWKMSIRGTFDEHIETLYKTENLYRVDGTVLREKEVSTVLLGYAINGEEITGNQRDEVANSLAEDVGMVSKLQLKFISENKLIIDEATDNVICTRAN